MARAMRFSVFRCHAVVANSNSVADDCLKALGTRVPIHAMLNGVDLERFAPAGDTLDLDQLSSLQPAPDGTFRVGLLATFARWKGQEVFLQALARVRQTHPHIRGYIIGGPIYQTVGSQFSLGELRRLAISLGLADHVGFTGFLTNAPAAMRSLDAVIHASTTPEPFGLVIAEAMACGRPVIVANAGGASEIITHNHDALGTTPGSAAEIAAAIIQLADDPELRALLARRARATVETRFSRARLAHSLAPLYLAARRACKSSTSIAEISTAA
jgi:glycosyltransferase involved in cell wall biosynthesis